MSWWKKVLRRQRRDRGGLEQEQYLLSRGRGRLTKTSECNTNNVGKGGERVQGLPHMTST